jgi:dihydrodipicolinate synthase/N-acetylneuraminate lyase
LPCTRQLVVNEPAIVARITPGRRISGLSAVLVPFRECDNPDWPAFEAHVGRTHTAGLVPAVNMDTGYVQQLADAERMRVLDLAASVTNGRFVAGAYVADAEGAAFDLDAYRHAADAVSARGGTPVIYPSHGLNALGDEEWVGALATLGSTLDEFIGFELGPMFVPHGRIVSLEAYAGMLEIRSCVGAKHSSLSRTLEWQRLELRDRARPDFAVYTGNDLAIDMVMYGSDYLLGLSTFAPDAFAARDAMWAVGDPRFHELNDLLQYLGQYAFRPPVPAYRHSAALFLELRGWAGSAATPAGVPRRPEADRDVLADILRRLEAWV